MWTFLVYNDDIFVLNKTEFVAYVEIKVGNTSKRCIQKGSWSTWFFYVLRKHIWLKVSGKGSCYKLKHQRTLILFCLPKSAGSIFATAQAIGVSNYMLRWRKKPTHWLWIRETLPYFPIAIYYIWHEEEKPVFFCRWLFMNRHIFWGFDCWCSHL